MCVSMIVALFYPQQAAQLTDIQSRNLFFFFFQVKSKENNRTKSIFLFCLQPFPNPRGNNGKKQLGEECSDVHCCSGDRVGHQHLLLLPAHCGKDFLCHLHGVHTVGHLPEKDWKRERSESYTQTGRQAGRYSEGMVLRRYTTSESAKSV